MAVRVSPVLMQCLATSSPPCDDRDSRTSASARCGLSRVGVARILVRDGRFGVGAVGLLGFGVLGVQLGRRDAAHQRGRRRPVLGADVDLGRLVGRVALLVQPRRLLRLLEHILQEVGAVAVALPVTRLERQLHAVRGVAAPQRHLGDSHRASAQQLRVRPAGVEARGHCLRRAEARRVHAERLLVLPLELELLRKLARDAGHLLWRERLGQLERLLPVQQVAPHLQRRHRPHRCQEELLRPRVVLEGECDVAGQQLGVLDVLQPAQREHHAHVAQFAVRALRERHVERQQRRLAQLQVELGIVQQLGNLPRAREAEQLQVLVEAPPERLGAGTPLGGHLEDGVVRRQRDVDDGPVVGLAEDGAVVRKDGGEPRLELDLAERPHGRPLVDLVRRVDVHRERLGVVHHQDPPVGRVPHHTDGGGREARDGQRLVQHRVEDEGQRGVIHKHEPRRNLVREEAGDARLVPVLADRHLIGQEDVGDGAARGAVNQKVLGHGHAPHVGLLVVWREHVRCRAVGLSDRVQRDAALGSDGHEVGVEQHLVDGAHVLALADQRAVGLGDGVEEDVVVHPDRHVRRPQRGERWLHRDPDAARRVGRSVGQRRADGQLEQRCQVHVVCAVGGSERGQASQEVVDAPGG
eukprot:scaffold20406_cov103-Isochrysis_galbana.AAC.4